MAINIFVLKGDLNGENRSGAFLFLSVYFKGTKLELMLNWHFYYVAMLKLSARRCILAMATSHGITETKQSQ